MALTTQQKDFWQENGYLGVEGVLSSQEVDNLRRGAEEIEARAAGLTQSTDRFKLQAFGDTGGGTRLQQIAEPHEIGGEWMALARHPRILDVVEGLLGPDVMLYYSMFMMKPPRQGFAAPWHQDFAFFVHDRAELLAIQLYIDDSTIENGCIRVVPGSHKLGLLNHFKDGVFTEIVQGDTSDFDARQVEVPMKAGGMVLWHSLTLHSSHPNRSDRPRRGITFEYKNPQARLMGGAFGNLEVQTVGLMVRGRDPRGDLLSAV
ncbi:MAG: phytanoyl-CoA dioxygenase family protein [Chloroflexota bacterium]|nr:phytanoyl-CoA dioxygenase family protein [Chloroflexota bacterium]